MNFLYTDGGVIKTNPSKFGATWAWCHVQQDQVVKVGAGIITPKHVHSTHCTNNQSELVAVLKGLHYLPADWIGTVASDSQITLGRLFLGWKFKNIPDYLVAKCDELKKKFIYWDQITALLLEGHPTGIDLKRGFGKSGRPVSIFNKWCDDECGRVGQEYYFKEYGET